MAIPIFGANYYDSPTAGGAIGSKAAELFATEGERLAGRIDSIANKNEAQAKAPVIASAMSDALTRISQGDFSGFMGLGKIQGEAAGNPFLMKMTEDAVREGGRIANGYMESQAMSKRIEMTADLQDKRDAAISQRQDKSNAAILSRQEEFQLATADRQSEANYNRLYAQYQKDQSAENEKAQIEGRQAGKLTPPEKPQYRSRTYGGPGAQTTEDLPTGGAGARSGVGNGSISPAEDDILGGISEPTGEAATGITSTAEQPLVNEKVVGPEAAAPYTGIKVGEPRKPESSGEKLVVPFGTMNWIFPKDKENNVKISRTISDSTGSTTYTYAPDKEGSPSVAAAKAITSVDTLDHEFAIWASDQMRQGKQVSVGPNPNDPKAAWTATAGGEPFGTKNPAAGKDPNAPAIIPRPVSKEVGEAWNKASQAIVGLKGQVGRDYPMTEAQVDTFTKRNVEMINQGETTLEKVNSVRKEVGLKPLSKDDLASGAQKSTASPETKKSLESRGIKEPGTQKKEEKDETPDEEIKRLQKEIKSAERKFATSATQENYNAIADKQEELDRAKKNLKKRKQEDSEDADLYGSNFR